MVNTSGGLSEIGTSAPKKERIYKLGFGPTSAKDVSDIWQLCQSIEISSVPHLFSILPEESEAAWNKKIKVGKEAQTLCLGHFKPK